MKKLGRTPDYLASHPIVFTMNLDGRVKPRSEVLKILNEKKLNKRKDCLHSVLCLPESKFLKGYLLPCKGKLPDMYELYGKKVGGQKIK